MGKAFLLIIFHISLRDYINVMIHVLLKEMDWGLQLQKNLSTYTKELLSQTVPLALEQNLSYPYRKPCRNTGLFVMKARQKQDSGKVLARFLRYNPYCKWQCDSSAILQDSI